MITEFTAQELQTIQNLAIDRVYHAVRDDFKGADDNRGVTIALSCPLGASAHDIAKAKLMREYIVALLRQGG